MKKLFLPLFCMLLLTSFSPEEEDHKYYFSLTHIGADDFQTQLQISMKVFSDDLDLALETMGYKDLDLGEKTESSESDLAVQTYLDKHFKLNVNAQPVRLGWVGKEVEMDITWIYLEYNLPSSINTLEVDNTVFMEIYEDQKHIVQVELQGREETLTFMKGSEPKVLQY